MATGLRAWLVGTLGACLVVALAALLGGSAATPPREPPPEPHHSRWAGTAGELSAKWQATEFRRRLEVYRDQLRSPVDSARAAGGTAPLLLIDGGATPAQRAELQGMLGDLWKQAAPLGFKVAVGLVIVRASSIKPTPDMPSLEQYYDNAYYVFPDSLHRGLCLSVMSDRYYGREFFDPNRKGPYRPGDGIRWLKQALGPCAFYGAFGIPGREMGRWINGQGYPFMVWPQWWIPEHERDYWPTYQDRPPARQPADWWVNQYSWLPWEGIECYAGRPGQCAADVFDSSALSDSQPAHWSARDWWRQQPLYNSVEFLSDVAQDIGAERFSQLWTADVPMDSAFHLATGRTLDSWTRAWVQKSIPPLPLGAAAPPLQILTGLIPALIALGAALWYARRRQIG